MLTKHSSTAPCILKQRNIQGVPLQHKLELKLLIIKWEAVESVRSESVSLICY